MIFILFFKCYPKNGQIFNFLGFVNPIWKNKTKNKNSNDS
jgi:hypothetical protein